MTKNNTLNVPILASDLADIETALMNVWSMVSPDAGPCSAREKAELVLDRVSGEAGKVIDSLIELHGYDAVERLVAKTLFGGK